MVNRGRKAAGLDGWMPVPGGVAPAPVPEDHERWRKHYVNPGTDFIALAMEEGKRGFAARNGRPYVHGLHTPERAEEIRSLKGPSVGRRLTSPARGVIVAGRRVANPPLDRGRPAARQVGYVQGVVRPGYHTLRPGGRCDRQVRVRW